MYKGSAMVPKGHPYSYRALMDCSIKATRLDASSQPQTPQSNQLRQPRYQARSKWLARTTNELNTHGCPCLKRQVLVCAVHLYAQE